MKKFLIINLFLCFSIFSSSYKIINTDEIELVFEEGLEEEAEKVANNISYLEKYYNDNNEKKLKKIPLVIKKGDSQSKSNFSDISKRMNFTITPSLDTNLGTTPWLINQSIYQYRRYYQYAIINSNFRSKFSYFILGNFGRSFYIHSIFPNWLFEGDAIYYETKLSDNGRGRNPSFLKEYRALLAEDKVYSYEKAKNGSYKDYVPNSNYLGYILISYGYEKYGEKFWKDIMASIGKTKKDRYKWTYLSNILEEKTGLDVKEFYKKAMNYFGEKYRVEKMIDYNQINIESKIPTSYIYAYKVNDGIISLKKSYNENASLYKIDKKNKENKLFTFGRMMFPYFQSKNDKVIWSEIEPDFKNNNKSYSNIKLYNLKDKIKVDLTSKSQYFMPSLSKKCKYIATIKNIAEKSNKIDILNINGSFIKEIINNDNYLYNYIDWIDEKSIIVSLRNNKGQMGIEAINIESLEEKEIVPFGDYIINSLSVANNNVYFTGSFDLVENVYRVNLDNKKIYKVTYSNIGTQGGTVIDSKLYFGEYSSSGYNLKVEDDIIGKETKINSLLETEKLNSDSFLHKELNLLELGKKENYKVEDYNYLKNLINFYSWEISNQTDSFNLNVVSSNEVENFITTLVYKSEDVDEDNIKRTLALQGLATKTWPNLYLEYEKEWGDVRYSNNLNFGMVFPFNFSKNEYTKILKIELNYIDYLNNNIEQYLSKIKINISKNKAYRDIVSENSQNINFSYRVDSNENYKINIDWAFTTRGIFKNDGFKYNFIYEKDKGILEFNDDKIISRGYENVLYDKLIKSTFDYYVPLYDLDLEVLGFYFSRLKTDVFYDNTKLDSNKIYSSLGNKFFIDGTFLSFFDSSIFIQYNYLIESEKNKIEIGVKFKS